MKIIGFMSAAETKRIMDIRKGNLKKTAKKKKWTLLPGGAGYLPRWVLKCAIVFFLISPAAAQYYPGGSIRPHAHSSATDGGKITNLTLLGGATVQQGLYVGGPVTLSSGTVVTSSTDTASYIFAVKERTESSYALSVATGGLVTSEALQIQGDGDEGRNLLTISSAPTGTVRFTMDTLGNTNFANASATVTVAGIIAASQALDAGAAVYFSSAASGSSSAKYCPPGTILVGGPSCYSTNAAAQLRYTFHSINYGECALVNTVSGSPGIQVTITCARLK